MDPKGKGKKIPPSNDPKDKGRKVPPSNDPKDKGRKVPPSNVNDKYFGNLKKTNTDRILAELKRNGCGIEHLKNIKSNDELKKQYLITLMEHIRSNRIECYNLLYEYIKNKYRENALVPDAEIFQLMIYEDLYNSEIIERFINELFGGLGNIYRDFNEIKYYFVLINATNNLKLIRFIIYSTNPHRFYDGPNYLKNAIRSKDYNVIQYVIPYVKEIKKDELTEAINTNDSDIVNLVLQPFINQEVEEEEELENYDYGNYDQHGKFKSYGVIPKEKKNEVTNEILSYAIDTENPKIMKIIYENIERNKVSKENCKELAKFYVVLKEDCEYYRNPL